MELLVENENEENKNSSRFNETNVAEELFDHHLIFSSFSATGAVSVKLLTDGHSSLPGIYLEINTPPPDRC